MRAVIFGCTGMIGGEILKLCLARSEVNEVVAISRKKLPVEHEKLSIIQHEDFTDYTKLKDVLKDVDIVYYCIGVYTGAVPKETFTRITVDFTKVCADAIKKYSPNATFCFLSGAGADSTETSSVLFARTKGIAENYLQKVGFNYLHIFRPAYIYPSTPRKEPSGMYALLRKLSFLLRWFYPSGIITSEELATVMYHKGIQPDKQRILENKDMKHYFKDLEL